MTDDIVTRLRESFSHPDVFTPAMFLDAADEIERLRADRDKWRKRTEQLSRYIKRNLAVPTEGCSCVACRIVKQVDKEQKAVRGD